MHVRIDVCQNLFEALPLYMGITSSSSMPAMIFTERVGGIMIFDLGVSAAPHFVDYINNRDLSAEEDVEDGGESDAPAPRFIVATTKAMNRGHTRIAERSGLHLPACSAPAPKH